MTSLAPTGCAWRKSLPLVLVCLMAAWAPTGGAAAREDAFRQGCQAYLSGDYPLAAASFQSLATRAPAAGTLHNLGNSLWNCRRTGEAVLSWERAHWLDPFSANTRANLRYARKAAQIEAPELAWYEVYSSALPVDSWAWVAGVSFWLAAGLLLLPGIFSWRKADWHQACAAVGFAAFLLTIPALVGVHTRSQLGVVLPQQAALRLTPTREAQTITRLNGGEMARLERERGDYLYIRLGNDTAGWIRRAEFGRICDRYSPPITPPKNAPASPTTGSVQEL